MESKVAESTQQMLLPGKCVDLYYPDPQTAEKQCYRTTINTKYVVGFNTLTGGVNVLTIPPNNGVGDILIQFVLTPPTVNTNTALPSGWGYNLLSRLSYRVGGSSQYFISGAQNLQNALRLCPDGASRNALLALGGPAITTAGDWANTNNLVAYVWLSMPWCKPTAVTKPPPLPTDLLTQQVQIQAEILSPVSILSLNGGATAGFALASAQFFVSQTQLQNQGDALARRVDMTLHSLSYPVEFTQQEFTIPLGNQTTSADGQAPQTVSLTGFRSGEVKAIQMFLTLDDDVSTAGLKNYNRFLAPTQILMTYAGDQYARYDYGQSQAWNLINGRQTSSANGIYQTIAGGAFVATSADIRWAELPFAQPFQPTTNKSMYVAGKEITNGIVQVQFGIPRNLDGSTISARPMSLRVSYIYNSVLVFSQGTADFAF